MSTYCSSVPIRWSDIDVYQHINHATMVTILEEARIPFLRPVFEEDLDTLGLLITEVHVFYKGQIRLIDSPLQVTMWVSQLRTVDFMIDYHVRSVNATEEMKPAVIAQTRLVAFHLHEQKLARLSAKHREYLQRFSG